MKRYLLAGLLVLSFLLLVSCASTHPTALKINDTREYWMPYVESNPNQWMQGADNWFLTGNPNNTEIANRHAPGSAAISTMMVNISDFNAIQSSGDFQLQIFGTEEKNSVFIYGPNSDVRKTTIELHGNTLCIGQTKDATVNMHQVIVRIGIHQLNKLIQRGRGCIEGIQLMSSGLLITSTGSGNIYLSGNLNVQRIVNAGRGSINLFGINSPLMDIKTAGTGSVNVEGAVGIRYIAHFGMNDINIIGANSNGLKIYAQGVGKIGIRGRVNLCDVITKGKTCAYIVGVNSENLHAAAFDKSHIGLAGFSENLYVDTYQSAKFAGRYLCTHSAYARAHDASHINVTATEKMFAAATQDASIYFFGSPTILTRFVSGNGTVILYEMVRVCPVVTIYPYPYLVKKPMSEIGYQPGRLSPQFAGEG
ncbi:MAG: DUF2807 domain-containing protein [Gammaproteobacteria bacterium]|nr:DUF2807 domain-containing protein [Gammaproteobacteria bacterium]